MISGIKEHKVINGINMGFIIERRGVGRNLDTDNNKTTRSNRNVTKNVRR